MRFHFFTRAACFCVSPISKRAFTFSSQHSVSLNQSPVSVSVTLISKSCFFFQLFLMSIALLASQLATLVETLGKVKKKENLIVVSSSEHCGWVSRVSDSDDHLTDGSFAGSRLGRNTAAGNTPLDSQREGNSSPDNRGVVTFDRQVGELCRQLTGSTVVGSDTL